MSNKLRHTTSFFFISHFLIDLVSILFKNHLLIISNANQLTLSTLIILVQYVSITNHIILINIFLSDKSSLSCRPVVYADFFVVMSFAVWDENSFVDPVSTWLWFKSFVENETSIFVNFIISE